jgi:hypothetical protein
MPVRRFKISISRAYFSVVDTASDFFKRIGRKQPPDPSQRVPIEPATMVHQQVARWQHHRTLVHDKKADLTPDLATGINRNEDRLHGAATVTYPKHRPSPKTPIPHSSFLDRIPKSRQPFYAVLFAVIGFVGACGTIRGLYVAWVSGQIEVFTGPKLHHIREIVFYDVDPSRFCWSLAGMAVLSLGFSGTAAAMVCRLLRRRP